MTYPILLTLDLGSTTGWAITSRTGRIMSGTAEFKHRKFEGGGMCYLRFERWITETHEIAGGFKAVYFRDSNITHLKNASEAYSQFIKTLTAWCEAQSIPYEGVPVTTIKNFISPQETTEKHETNALALMSYAREQHHIWKAI